MFLDNNFSASETHYTCDLCSEAVTNPLCPFCLTTEVKAWLTLYPDLKRELLPRIRKHLNNIEDNMREDATTCLKCGDNLVSVCPYCFTRYVLDELRKIHVNKIILYEFFQFFNFDLHKTGYSKEIESMEVL